MVVANDHTANTRLEGYLHRISTGETAALVSDGGMPVVSDPGTEIVDQAHEAGIQVEVIPGPSAPICALAASGFYGQRFVFLGFLPRKPGDVAKVLTPFAESALTIVLFESPHRITKTLEIAFTVLGSRRVAVCRELTKLHEQVERGTLAELETIRGLTLRGEFTVVIEGRRRNEDAEH